MTTCENEVTRDTYNMKLIIQINFSFLSGTVHDEYVIQTHFMKKKKNWQLEVYQGNLGKGEGDWRG